MVFRDQLGKNYECRTIIFFVWYMGEPIGLSFFLVICLEIVNHIKINGGTDQGTLVSHLGTFVCSVLRCLDFFLNFLMMKWYFWPTELAKLRGRDLSDLFHDPQIFHFSSLQLFTKETLDSTYISFVHSLPISSSSWSFSFLLFSSFDTFSRTWEVSSYNTACRRKLCRSSVAGGSRIQSGHSFALLRRWLGVPFQASASMLHLASLEFLVLAHVLLVAIAQARYLSP